MAARAGDALVEMTTTLATRRGWQAEPAPDALTQVKQHVSGALPSMLQFTAQGGAPEAELYSALAMQMAGVPAGMPTDGLMYYLAEPKVPRGPLASSRLTEPGADSGRRHQPHRAGGQRAGALECAARKAELAKRVERGGRGSPRRSRRRPRIA